MPACLRNSFRTTSISTQKATDASLICRALQFGTSTTALLASISLSHFVLYHPLKLIAFVDNNI